MNKTEKLQKINQYKIFRIYFELTRKYINPMDMNYSEVLLKLQSEKEFWKNIDEKHGLTEGYSLICENLINQLHIILDDDTLDFKFDDESDCKNFIMRNIQSINNCYLVKSESYNSVTFCLPILSKDENFVSLIKTAYIKLLGNAEKDTFQKLIDLFSHNLSLETGIRDIRNQNKSLEDAVFTYIGLKTKNINNISQKSDIDYEIDELKSTVAAYKDIVNQTQSTLLSDTIDYQNQLQAWNKEKEDWYQLQMSRLDELEQDYKQRLEDMEKIYNEKLRLEEPVKFWREKAEEQKKSYNKGLFCTVVLSVSTIAIGAFLIWSLYDKVFVSVEQIKSFIPYSFIMVALVSFLVYLLRMAIKMMMSSRHLQIEYQQKEFFTYFYLTLLNDEKTKSQISATEKNLIFQTLFNLPDTGLIKSSGNDNGDIMGLLTALISKK